VDSLARNPFIRSFPIFPFSPFLFRFIIIDGEIVSAQKEKSDSIEIINFVERSKIPPVYYSDSYYLSPERIGVDLFALLLKAMIDTGKVRVGKIVMRSKENLVEKNAVTRVDPSLQIDRLWAITG